MTLLQHLKSGPGPGNDAEISEILRMKNQKRIQNVMTGGGIIFDNTSKIEKEEKPSKTTSVLINGFDNDLINSLFLKNLSLETCDKGRGRKSCDAEGDECHLPSSLATESNPLNDSFPLLSGKSPLQPLLSSPPIQESDGIQLSFQSPPRSLSPDPAESDTTGSNVTEAPSSVGAFPERFEESNQLDFIDLFRGENPFLPKFEADTATSAETSLNIFDADTSQKLAELLFDVRPSFNLKSPFSTSPESNDESLRSNLNDLSSLEKNIADKDPFAPVSGDAAKTVFNIAPAAGPASALVKFPGKPGSSESVDHSEDNNLSSSGSESDAESVDVKALDKAKTVNNIQILSNTLKSLKLSCWYYENLSHLEAIKLLSSTQPGTFLVRNSSDSKFLFTLSIQTYRQPTSIRIQYNNGKFCLDCENSVTETIPKFSSIMDLIGYYIKLTSDTIHYINNNVVNENKQVLIDEYGKIFSNILLTKPLYSSTKVPSLKHLTRVSLNRFKEFGYSYKIPSEELRKYMNEYPFTI
ncbi:unnamed protein product [Bemisia tabaci]|uniref:SH2 domain-containing protein n=1 Tax=Bemisia tabaci TaxID=7038 RepID=A0A9P0EYA1_BEMTA|nr:unnamed protein product [Bemisia tabaci]